MKARFDVATSQVTFLKDAGAAIFIIASVACRAAAATPHGDPSPGALNDSDLGVKSVTTGANVQVGGVLAVRHEIRPLQPAPQAPLKYPLGNDLLVDVSGPADLRLKSYPLDLRIITTAVPGRKHSVEVAGSTAGLCPPSAGCSLTIDPDGEAQEQVGPANWQISGPSSLNINFVLGHRAPFVVRQSGALFFDVRQVLWNGDDAADRPVRFLDRNRNVLLIMPNDGSRQGSFPLNTLQVAAVITGGNGRVGDLVHRNRTGRSVFRWLASDGSPIQELDDRGRLAVHGGMTLVTKTQKPACTANSRGTFWFVSAGPGQADSVEVCAKSSDDTYTWRIVL